ncbi:MAG: choice-of-anchor J domain-containing protein [Chitinophagaceae bacterium]|nr:choice-of-anchor J domain-containing protein [Chitinophagaceae bacterium]
MKRILLSLSALLLMSTAVQAQIPYSLSGTSYLQDFDNIGSGLPMGWRVDSAVNKNAGLGNDAQFRFSPTATSWGGATSRGFKNVASADGLTATSSSAQQAASMDRALSARQVSASGWDDHDSLISWDFTIANTTGLTAFNLQFKLQCLPGNSGRYNHWIVQYGLGANPATFTTVATNPATLTMDSLFNNVSVSVNFGSALDNQNQQIWIRITPDDTTMGSGNRPLVALDDFNLTWTGTAAGNPKPLIASLAPADNATGVTITTVPVVTFDKNITAGTGNIYIKNLTDATTQTIAVASVSISGMSATLTGTTLVNAKNYAIQFDSTAFMAGVNNSYGIYDTTSWNFMTASTVNPPVTSLNEPFTNCLYPSLGSFTENSVIGTQTWRCSNFGRNDTDAVYVNGYAAGATNDNEDWLLTPAINVSAMSNPYFHFWSKKRFSGNNTKDVLISNNYTGIGDPNLATWTNLNINFSSMDTIYIPFNNAALSAYKSTPFYVAFKYVSSSAGTADEWSIDDVSITDGPVSVRSFNGDELKITVLGTVSGHYLPLAINSQSNKDFSLRVMSMTGALLSEQKISVNQGKSNMNIELPALANGLYLLSVSDGVQQATLKFNKL